MTARLSANIVVLNYGGHALLERFLPSITAAAQKSPTPCRVTVLDNDNSPANAQFVREHFAGADYLPSENKVLSSYNTAAKVLKEDILIFLNNDIEVDVDFVAPLVQVFEKHSDAFFAATEGDVPIAAEHWGVIAAELDYPKYKKNILRAGYCYSAGIGAFDRKKFIELGGYDPLYLPGRYEDVDLCHRGWKRGWKGYYAPTSRKMHLGAETFKNKYSREEIQALVYRNSLLFMTKNITDRGLFLKFALLLPFRLIAALLRGQFFVFQGFFQAMTLLPRAWAARKKEKPLSRLTDRQVLDLVNQGRVDRGWMALARGSVEVLHKIPFLRRIFFGLTSFNLRITHPLQYLILRELLDCETVVDLGCGRHSMVPIIPETIETTGVELFEPHYKEAAATGRHHRYMQADLTQVEFPDKNFDAVVLLDVIEHLAKEDGQALLGKMNRWAKKKVIVFTPNGFLPQEGYADNPYLEHKSGWEVEELKKQGFKIYGVRGFKFLYNTAAFDHAAKERGGEAAAPNFGTRLNDLTQLWTYYFPKQALQLFCVKNIS